MDREIIKALKTCDTPKTLSDEDQSFFDTILPSVQVMTEDEKYEFRISVLKLVHDIKKNGIILVTHNLQINQEVHNIMFRRLQ